MLFILSATLSSIALATIFISTKFHAISKSSWGQLTLFPAIWATIWCVVSYISPVGHLSTWSVAKNEDAYSWILPLLGPVSKDWIVASWAVVLAQAIGRWYIGAQESEDEFDLMNPQNQSSEHNMRATGFLALFLVFLTLPSFVWSDLPRSASLSTLNVSTPVAVGCVLPPYERYKHHILTLDDYITETDKIRSNANILLWPEGAVTFHSVAEREDAFHKIRSRINDGKYVGVSFEDVVSDPSDSTGRRSLIQTGLALISSKSNETHLSYYKRHLVPLAESYRLRHSNVPPSIFDLPLPPPKNIKKGDWAPPPNNTRLIPVTSSICLDFAMPSPFAELESKPALILAPARTWDITVGHAMWLQAKQRAEELDTMVLWCDGGEGGVSGVAGKGYNDVYQVGPGSFTRIVGVQYPFDSRQTVYASFGDSILILFWISALGLGFLRGNITRYMSPSIRSAMQHLKRGRRNGADATTQPSLLDL
ncbi:hypothetical protein CPB84DRAFT_508780 [Gymnopilus junonius]|uniref:CN hydrolase domain-containing protein n=1 Tax=Gymnopilus junonius TaxID=109634 RepID=A0A9P5P0K5_GYMJU|nr:hypothetical protein CPB84DRAFT_508780 [Gymnopilus junonius]